MRIISKASENKQLLKENYFRLQFTGKIIRVTHKTPKGFSHAIKIHFTKNKIDFSSLVPDRLFCEFCGCPNAYMSWKTHTDGKLLIIDGIEYRDKKDVHYCYANKQCPGKHLNPNSIKFVSTVRKITKEEALAYIHDRNKTPFYSDNHKNREEYRKYQGTRITENKSDDEISQIIKRQNYSRSLECYVQRFGDVEGTSRWKAIQKSKGITLENLTRVHGANAKDQLDKWKSRIGRSLDNFVRRYGTEEGLKAFRKFHISTRKNKTNAFGCVTEIDGFVLRSNLERKFYAMLKAAGIPKEEIRVDGYYPNSILRYDFYFPRLVNVYIEIAGLTTEEYLSKINHKVEEFKCIVFTAHDIMNNNVSEYVEYIAETIEQLRNKNEHV